MEKVRGQPTWSSWQTSSSLFLTHIHLGAFNSQIKSISFLPPPIFKKTDLLNNKNLLSLQFSLTVVWIKPRDLCVVAKCSITSYPCPNDHFQTYYFSPRFLCSIASLPTLPYFPLAMKPRTNLRSSFLILSSAGITCMCQHVQ